MTRRFFPFEIQIEAGDAGSLRVEARFLGSVRTESIPANLPLLAPREIQQARDWLARGFIDMDYARDFGNRLFQSIFQGAVLELLREGIQRVAPDDGLRLMLSLPMPGSLADLPWELLFDARGGNGFLARSESIALARHFTDLPLPHEIPGQGPLRVLFVAASPEDRPPISQEKEAEAILGSLQGRRLSFLETLRIAYQHVRHAYSFKGLAERIKQRSLVEFDLLSNATRPSLQHKLLEARNAGRPYHVIHFAGHGESNEEGSFLALVDNHHLAELVSGEEFAELVDGPVVNLVFLNACKSASSDGAVSSLAESLLRRGIPGVIGMQVPVLDLAALDFAREFYRLWAAGEPLESALGLARRLISREKRTQAADWSIPVLYMGPKDGLTLAMDTPSAQTPRPVRFLRWGFATLISLIGTITLLLSVPDTATALRKQVPLLRCWYPAEMSEQSKFNIVVTEFPILNDKGRRIAGNEGSLLANDIYDRLLGGFDEISIEPEIRPPGETCPIIGSPEERSEKARKLAYDIGADLVIYGVVQEHAPGPDFKPEFYVSYLGFEQADEVIGDNEMGLPVSIPDPLTKEVLLNSKSGLGARSEALADITLGLAHYSLDDMLSAADYFEKAHALEGWPEVASGKEVIHLMWGNALARQASLTVRDVLSKKVTYDDWKDKLEQARQQYLAALAHNPLYPRAKVGLASVDMTLARGEPGSPNSAIDMEMVAQAETLYHEAAQMPAEEEFMIPTKVHFGLGQIYLALAQDAQRQASGSADISQPVNLVEVFEDNLDLAQVEFSALIDEYYANQDERLKVRIKDLASHSNANLAVIKILQGDNCGAIPFINEAYDLATPYYQARYKAFLGQTYESIHHNEQALEAYQEGFDAANFQGDGETMAALSVRIDQLKNDPSIETPIPCTIPTAVPDS